MTEVELVNGGLSVASLLLFAAATVGLTNIIVQGKILDEIGFRPYMTKNAPALIVSMMGCFECAGFWSGLLCGAMLLTWNPVVLLLCGWAGSILSSFYNTVNQTLEGRVEIIYVDEQGNPIDTGS